MYYGLGMCLVRKDIGLLLHTYNALRCMGQIQSIPLFDQMCNILGHAVFRDEAPTRNFEATCKNFVQRRKQQELCDKVYLDYTCSHALYYRFCPPTYVYHDMLTESRSSAPSRTTLALGEITIQDGAAISGSTTSLARTIADCRLTTSLSRRPQRLK